MNHWYGWALACVLALIGVWREVSGWRTRTRFEERIDKLESGATYRELQEFCLASVKAVRRAHDQMDGMRRAMDAMRLEAEAMAGKLAEQEQRLGAALLECAQWEERVNRLLATRRPP